MIIPCGLKDQTDTLIADCETLTQTKKRWHYQIIENKSIMLLGCWPFYTLSPKTDWLAALWACYHWYIIVYNYLTSSESPGLPLHLNPSKLQLFHATQATAMSELSFSSKWRKPRGVSVCCFSTSSAFPERDTDAHTHTCACISSGMTSFANCADVLLRSQRHVMCYCGSTGLHTPCLLLMAHSELQKE